MLKTPYSSQVLQSVCVSEKYVVWFSISLRLHIPSLNTTVKNMVFGWSYYDWLAYKQEKTIQNLKKASPIALLSLALQISVLEEPTSSILKSVLPQIHILFPRGFSTEFDLVRPLSISSILSFSQGHAVASQPSSSSSRHFYPLYLPFKSVFQKGDLEQDVTNPVCLPSFYFLWYIPVLLFSL